jgi:hypothetical protein
MWFLKSLFDQNLIVINYKLNGDFKSHLIFGVIQEKLLALLQLPRGSSLYPSQIIIKEKEKKKKRPPS